MFTNMRRSLASASLSERVGGEEFRNRLSAHKAPCGLDLSQLDALRATRIPQGPCCRRSHPQLYGLPPPGGEVMAIVEVAIAAGLLWSCATRSGPAGNGGGLVALSSNRRLHRNGIGALSGVQTPATQSRLEYGAEALSPDPRPMTAHIGGQTDRPQLRTTHPGRTHNPFPSKKQQR